MLASIGSISAMSCGGVCVGCAAKRVAIAETNTSLRRVFITLPTIWPLPQCAYLLPVVLANGYNTRTLFEVEHRLNTWIEHVPRILSFAAAPQPGCRRG